MTGISEIENCTILLVEDGQTNRNIIKNFLVAENYRLLFATDYDDALQILDCNPVDLVLMEAALPGRDGFDLCHKIRQTEHISETPVVMITSREGPELRGKGFDSGVDDFISKPINRDELRARVRTILRLNYYRTLHVSDASKNGKDAELNKLKRFDPTTGLANLPTFRKALEEEIERAQGAGYSIAVMATSANEIDQVHGVYGETVAETLSRNVANRLGGMIRGRGLVGRIEGRCFVSYQPIPRQEELLSAVQSARRVFNEPFVLNDEVVNVSSTIGASVYPSDADDAERLISLAVSAMTQAAKKGRNHYQVSAPNARADVKRQLRVEGQVIQALADEKFELHYQPRVRLSDGRITAVEALLRMRDDNGEYIPPGIFLPVAHNAGLMTQLGVRTINEACRNAATLREQGRKDTRVCINLTGEELRHSDFMNEVRDAMKNSHISGEQLEFDINESALVPQHDFDLRALGALLSELHAEGIRVAIDDFGTGYSSLTYLRHIPMDSLKIDQSFIRDIPRDAKASAVACSVIALGQNLGMTVIAEGVENDTQLSFLRQAGCDEVQGYLYARPMPFELLSGALKQIEYDWSGHHEQLSAEEVTLSGDSVESSTAVF